jgi:Tol biopolymer transport system component
VLRAGPNDEGEYPQRGSFEVVEFRVGSKARAPSFEGAVPTDLAVGESRRIARGAPCTPPHFLADGRLAVGTNVVDPESGVTIEVDIAAHQLAWSPVGDKLAILTPDRKEIQLAAPDGSGAVTRVREARGLLSSLSWSPSGDRLAFIADRDPATRQLPGDPTGATVKILNATNGTQTVAGPGLAVAWSPDPEMLAVEMSGSVVERSNPAGQRAPLTTGRKPAWSHDGSFLSVVRNENDQWRGWIVPATGQATSQGGVAVTDAGSCAMSFSPAGDYLAVVSEAGGETSVQLRTLGLRGQAEG